jgi:hypothetical protein
MTHPPGSVPRPRKPAVVKWAAGVMFAGAAITASWGFIVARLDPPSPPSGYAGLGVIFGEFLGVAGSVPWLLMACLALAGYGWARIASAILFGAYLVALVPDVIVSFIPAASRQSAGFSVVAGVGVELLAGLAAVVLLFLPASGWFFSASRQARAASAERWPG